MGTYNSVPPNATFFRGAFSGGATDIRLKDGDYYDFDSLKSRIMVAASGGSLEWQLSTPSPAGGLSSNYSITSFKEEGSPLLPIKIFGANQTHPGFSNDIRVLSGKFGIPGYTTNATQDWGGTGGNGYYAGASTLIAGGSTGGSSFISGHLGCDAISNESSSFEDIHHTGQPIHYSNLSFFNTQMIDGKGKTPLPWVHFKPRDYEYEEFYETGRSGNGFVRITVLNEAIVLTCQSIHSLSSFDIFLQVVFFSRA
ncbi:hypothetical protein TVAG_489210 [Trichomonas vaginalis G3]|uniref:receptor protein-tyrosine kinase n=1 Tax=Trichomonas vaginalis (strain ATCC PRA-98 / G3) TaxID=412133 RepID=A2EVD1_TRIV3|nr:glycine-rich protein family [Trichomonas vaginalis G3]EAY03377.1 hypothetical protein TVAG_489210 [Trichomonas vaginalis G3]KAI5538092.1 glycine-rich protein family [Trichomonas vaginalis G3]|eukprot:XP_001315600.1 hypothetical protein [Trichomonas vaginalis G3]